MRHFFAIGVLFVSILGAAGCGSDSGTSTPREGGAATGGVSCDQTCPGILAANCSAGPTSQSDCVTGCETVRTGHCASQFQAMYACGGSSPKYTCTAAGQVGIVGCDAQTSALWTCVSGP